MGDEKSAFSVREPRDSDSLITDYLLKKYHLLSYVLYGIQVQKKFKAARRQIDL